MSRRRDRLSFQHHAEVAALTRDEQELWLDRAQAFSWSKAELRHRVRPQPDQGEITVLVLRLEVGRPREERWHAAADRADSTFEEWLGLVLDNAASHLLDEDPELNQCATCDLVRTEPYNDLCSEARSTGPSSRKQTSITSDR